MGFWVRSGREEWFWSEEEDKQLGLWLWVRSGKKELGFVIVGSVRGRREEVVFVMVGSVRGNRGEQPGLAA